MSTPQLQLLLGTCSCVSSSAHVDAVLQMDRGAIVQSLSQVRHVARLVCTAYFGHVSCRLVVMEDIMIG